MAVMKSLICASVSVLALSLAAAPVAAADGLPLPIESQQFAPGGEGAARFPRVVGWVLPQR
jgi:hypothetical protein